MINQEEAWALLLLTNAAKNAQAELGRTMAARDSCIKLLEGKYKATFNHQTGEFTPTDIGD